jgi:hypothetical protein
MCYLEPVLATPPVAEAMEPTGEVIIGKWFVINVLYSFTIFFFIFIYYLDPALAAPSTTEPVNPAEEVAGNQFSRIFFSYLISFVFS